MLFESGAILLYLAEKSGRFLGADPAARYEAIQWLMFQMGGVGPMFGQLGFFHKFAGKDWEDKRPRDRYVAESRRLLKVLEQHLAGREWMLGSDYSIADIATWPWVNNLIGFYGAGELVGFAEFANVKRVLDAFPRGRRCSAAEDPAQDPSTASMSSSSARAQAQALWHDGGAAEDLLDQIEVDQRIGHAAHAARGL